MSNDWEWNGEKIVLSEDAEVHELRLRIPVDAMVPDPNSTDSGTKVVTPEFRAEFLTEYNRMGRFLYGSLWKDVTDPEKG